MPRFVGMFWGGSKSGRVRVGVLIVQRAVGWLGDTAAMKLAMTPSAGAIASNLIMSISLCHYSSAGDTYCTSSICYLDSATVLHSYYNTSGRSLSSNNFYIT